MQHKQVNPMMSHSLGNVKCAFVCSANCGGSKGWTGESFYRKKVKITSAYLIAMCAGISCCNSNILFTHNTTLLAVMKVRQAYLLIKYHVSKSTSRV